MSTVLISVTSYSGQLLLKSSGNPDGLRARGNPSQEEGWVPAISTAYKLDGSQPRGDHEDYVFAAAILVFFAWFLALFYIAFFLSISGMLFQKID